MTTITPINQSNRNGDVLKRGVVWGISAGIIFAVFEMVMNMFLGQSFLGPLRMISSIALGAQALDPGYSILTAGAVGLIIHVILSAVYGVIFVRLLGLIKRFNTPLNTRMLFGLLFGLALWVVNFLIIAPVAFPQFTEMNQFWNGFVAHTFVFGAALGIFATVSKPITAASVTRIETVSDRKKRAA